MFWWVVAWLKQCIEYPLRRGQINDNRLAIRFRRGPAGFGIAVDSRHDFLERLVMPVEGTLEQPINKNLRNRSLRLRDFVPEPVQQEWCQAVLPGGNLGVDRVPGQLGQDLSRSSVGDLWLALIRCVRHHSSPSKRDVENGRGAAECQRPVKPARTNQGVRNRSPEA